MATAPPPSTRPRQVRRTAPPPAPRWRRWLLLGLFFGLGYGLTQRLLEVRWGEGTTRTPSFQPKATPAGTPLEELRRQTGENTKPLPTDLEELARKQREEKEKAKAAKQEASEREATANEAEKNRLESERRRLEESTLEPSNPSVSTPMAPDLPPPTPVPLMPPPPPPSQPSTEAPAPLP
jgi:hypothetical protein